MAQNYMWTSTQLRQHIQAAALLGTIKNDVAQFLRENPKTSELEVQQAVLDFFRIRGIKMDSHKPIVAFGKNTSHVHYFVAEQSNTKLKKNTLILLDIWGRLKQPKAPYADMTWMFYYGDTVPPKLEGYFKHVLKARDRVMKKIKYHLRKKEYPVGADLDMIARTYLEDQKLGQYFRHSLGHSLGTRSPHGVYGGLRRHTKTPIVPMLGYTNEPGIYFPNKYGFRSEIDFYITKGREVRVTTPVQRKIELIKPGN